MTRVAHEAAPARAEHAPVDGPHAGHDQHARHSVAMFRDKFWLSLALTIPIVVLSHDIQQWLGYSVHTFPGSEYLPAILGTILFFYCQ